MPRFYGINPTPPLLHLLKLENTLEVKPERTIVVYASFNGGPHHQQLEVAGAHLDFIVAATDASHPTPL